MRNILIILIITLCFNSELYANTATDTTERKVFNESNLSERRWNRYKQSDYTDLKAWANKRKNFLKSFGYTFAGLGAFSSTGGPIIPLAKGWASGPVGVFINTSLHLPLISLPFFIRAKKYQAILNESRIDYKPERFFRFGVKFGMVFSDLPHAGLNREEMGSYYTIHPKAGIGGGAYVCFNFNTIIGIQPEVLVLRKGRKIEGDDVVSNTNNIETLFRTQYLDYLDIPVQIKTTLPIWNKINPSFYIGPCFSFLIDTKEKGEYEKSKEYNYKKSIKGLEPFDISYVWGISFDFPIGKGIINLDVKNIEGTRSLSEKRGALYYHRINRVFFVLIGYSL